MHRILLIVLLGAFMPRYVARRTQSATRSTVITCYAIGLSLGCAALLWAQLLCAIEAQPVYGIPDAAGTVTYHTLAIDPVQYFVAALDSIITPLVVTWLAVLIALPYAWRDEALRHTWRHAVRTVHLFAPAWMLPATGFGSAFIFMTAVPAPDLGPFIFKLFLLTPLSLWTFAIVTASVSADRQVRTADHEPLCERCGYLLHHLPDSRRCPECGDDVTPAIEPTHRWWRHPEQVEKPWSVASDPLIAQTPSIAAWRRPRDLFSRVWLAADCLPFLRTVAAWFAATGLVSGFILWTGINLIDRGSPPPEAALVFCGGICALITGVFGLWSVGAGIVGLIASIQAGRNLLRAAFIVAACTSAFFPIWAGICTVSVMIIPALANAGAMYYIYWAIFGWLTLNTGMAVLYIVAVWRRMRYVRYGNWQFSDRRAESDEAGVALAEQAD